VCVCVCVCVQLQKPLSAGVPPVFGRSVRVNLSSCNYCEFCWRVSQDWTEEGDEPAGQSRSGLADVCVYVCVCV